MNDMIDVVGKAVCRHGTLSFPKDYYIGQSLDIYGEYSEQEVIFLCSLLKPGDVVVEAGANVGAITVPMAKTIGMEGIIFAYEPQIAIFAMLENNLELNASVTHLATVNAALGKIAGTARYASNSHNTGAVRMDTAGDFPAEIHALDDLDLKHLDLLKADVEGMEIDVLLGARRTIAHCRPLIYVENDRPDNARRLVDTLFAFGYRLWQHNPPLFNVDNFRGVKEDIFKDVMSFNIIAVPEEREVPDQIIDLVEIVPGPLCMPGLIKERWACVARMGGFGDNLMASSVLPGLKAKYGKVEVISQAPAHEIFSHNPYVDKLTVWQNPADVDPLEWSRRVAARMKEYDFGIHLSHSCESKMCFFESQTEFHWPDKMRRKMADQSYLGYLHDICDLPHVYAPNFFPAENEIGLARKTLAKVRAGSNAPVIGWCLSGSRIDKAYPGSAAAIARLLDLGARIIMFGAPGKEFLMAKEIERQVLQQTGADERGSSQGLFLAMSDNIEKPNWPVRRSFTQVQACDLVIAPDTGPAWAVAMREMPKVILLSHASPKNITTGWVNTTTLHADQARVPCWPCHRLQDRWDTCNKAKDVDAATCMADIPINAIVGAVRNALGL